MLKKFLRWPTLTVFMLLLLVAAIPIITFFRAEKPIVVHAKNPHGRVAPHLSKLHHFTAPALSTSANTVHVYQTISVQGQGFEASEIVQIQLDNATSLVLKNLTCDNNGSFSGLVTMPTSSVLQGIHPLIASGKTSAITAQTPLTFVASMSTTPLTGSAWTTLSLVGSSFAANEPIDVYWGKQSPVHLSTLTANVIGDISYQFTVPAGMTPGKYPIIAYRFRQTPRTIGTQFQIVPPKMTSTAGILNGQIAQAQLHYFQPYEVVTISWNANGQQQVATGSVDSTGSGIISFTPPSASRGSYILTAVGNTSGGSATSKLNIGPGIAITPNSAGAASTITVTGGGYTAGTLVNVYFQNTANGVVSAQVSSDGTFTASLIAPAVYKSDITYYVYAVSSSSKEKATAQYTFVPSSISVCSYCNYYYGSSFPISGQGFSANELVNIYWSYGQAAQTLAGTSTADVHGAFSATLTVPSAPQGSVVIAAVGSTSYLKAMSSTNEYASMVLSSYSVTVGSSVQVKVGGLQSNESARVTVAGTTVLSGTADATGFFTGTFLVPTSSYGNTYVQAYGSSSGNVSGAYIYVSPSLTLTPTTVSSGTSVTINGYGFPTYYYYYYGTYVYWYNPNYGSTGIGYVNVASDGTFVITFTPYNLVSGNTYSVCANNYYAGTVCTTFTA